MTKVFSAVRAVIVIVLTAVLPVRAERGNRPGIDVGADFYGKYVWRGQLLNDDPVFQPSVGISWGNLSASIWGNMDFTDYTGNQQKFTEYDYSVDYSSAVPGIDWLSFSVGSIFYYFPSLDAETTELYWGVSLDVSLSPSITVYHDIDEIDGTYVVFGVSHSVEKLFELDPQLPVGMEISASAGLGDSDYNKGYWGVADARANDLTVSASFPVALAGWKVAPNINYAALLSDTLKETDTFSKESDYLFAGVSLSGSF